MSARAITDLKAARCSQQSASSPTGSGTCAVCQNSREMHVGTGARPTSGWFEATALTGCSAGSRTFSGRTGRLWFTRGGLSATTHRPSKVRQLAGLDSGQRRVACVLQHEATLYQWQWAAYNIAHRRSSRPRHPQHTLSATDGWLFCARVGHFLSSGASSFSGTSPGGHHACRVI
eukprot:1333965-Prymnesium_polylepis.1